MLDRAEFDRWYAMARDALAAAQTQAARGAHHWACFLAEQAAQFACKGLLYGIGLPAWGHDLTVLGTRIRAESHLTMPEGVADGLTRLSRHYIATRYPDAHPAGTPASHYRRSDAVQARTDAEGVLAFVSSSWAALLAAAEGGDGGQ